MTNAAALPDSGSATVPRGSRLRRWVARGLLLCASIVLALIVGEVALRVLSPGYSPLFLDIYAMEDGVLTLRPDIERKDVTAEWSVAVTITADGLRDRATPVPEDGGRVLLIGDSFAFGWGVELEQSLGYVAEEKLRPDRIRIIKAGLSVRDRWLWEFFQVHLKDPPPETVASFEQMRSVLDRMHNGCVERGMDMLLLILPRSFQIYDWELQHWLESYELTPDKLDLDRPQRELTEWAKGRGAAVLDVLPALRAYAKRQPDDRAYFFPNAHMNAVGHRVTGEALADAVRALLVKPHPTD